MARALQEMTEADAEGAGEGTTATRRHVHYPALDGMRGVGFLLVFLFHYLALPWGWAGVELFFVLSGFLITGILYDTRNDPHCLRNFYIRRTLRIFPLYWATLAVVLAAALLVHARMDTAVLGWVAYVGNLLPFLHRADAGSTYALVTQGDLLSARHPPLTEHIGHFWTLCVEEQFYLAWPAMVLLLRRRKALIGVCTALIVLCPAARLLAQAHAPAWMLGLDLNYRLTVFRVDAFAYGGLLALVRRGPGLRRLNRVAGIGLAVMLAVTAVLVGPHLLDPLRGRVYLYPAWDYTWGLVMTDAVCFCVLVKALEPGSWVSRGLSHRWLRWIGGISYGAYVFHYIPITLEGAILYHLPLRHMMLPMTAAMLAATLGVAWVSFRFFETPLIRLKDRFARPTSAMGRNAAAG